MNSKRFKEQMTTLWLSAVIVSLFGLSTVAASDTYDGAVNQLAIEEVLVVSRKREEIAQKVPISMTVQTGEELTRRGASQIEDIAFGVPNFLFQESTSVVQQDFQIRGIEGDNNNPGIDPGVGLYIDGVYIARGTAYNGLLQDVERVEVLRGPQGSVFGKNTTGGALNIITKRPDLEKISGSASLEYGRFDLFEASGTVSMPVVEGTSAISASVATRQADGYVDNLTTGTDIYDQDSLAGRVQFLYAPAENLDIALSFDGARDRANDTLLVGQGLNFATFAGNLPGVFDREVLDELDPVSKRDLYGGSININYTMNSGHTITSVTAGRHYDSFFSSDNDHAPVFLLSSGRSEEHTQISQELRIASPENGRFTWMAGLYYLDVDFDAVSEVGAGVAFFNILAGPGFATADEVMDINADQSTSSVAVFGTINYEITERLKLAIGARYTHETKDITWEQVSGPSLEVFFGNTVAPIEDQVEANEFTPDVSLSYDLTDKAIAFFRYARGFKNGGFNGSVVSGVSPITVIDDFRAEKVDSFEFGLKSRWFNDQLQFNITGFKFDFKNFQNAELVPLSGFLTDNIAELDNIGFEVEMMARPAKGLDIYFGAGYQKFENGSNTTSPGSSVGSSRPWNMNGGAQYRFPVSSNFSGVIRADFVWQDRTNSGDLDSYIRVDGRIGLESQQSDWGIYLYADNLTNEKYIHRTGAGFFGTEVLASKPRWWGIQLRGAFN